eukprot:TRINITY_DN13962_c0_g1_i2.p1 TRINITY_DN13962_c0_g1~~TRINITY_DN13962_c0_g1_i2.p1  ORF type:complete len:145 (+),score=20.40 TRINITY_DN13962_c0_g1_i2:186-620(+)
MMTSSTPGKSPPTSRSTAGESAVRPAGGPSSSLVPVPRPPTDSLFQSVTYTISGRIPNAHTHFNPRIGDQHLRVSLNSPAIQESDADIVVSCSVSTRTPVTLTSVSYTHLRAHETPEHLVCRLLLEKKKKHTLNKDYIIYKHEK